MHWSWTPSSPLKRTGRRCPGPRARGRFRSESDSRAKGGKEKPMDEAGPEWIVGDGPMGCDAATELAKRILSGPRAKSGSTSAVAVVLTDARRAADLECQLNAKSVSSVELPVSNATLPQALSAVERAVKELGVPGPWLAQGPPVSLYRQCVAAAARHALEPKSPAHAGDVQEARALAEHSGKTFVKIIRRAKSRTSEFHRETISLHLLERGHNFISVEVAASKHEDHVANPRIRALEKLLCADQNHHLNKFPGTLWQFQSGGAGGTTHYTTHGIFTCVGAALSRRHVRSVWDAMACLGDDSRPHQFDMTLKVELSEVPAGAAAFVLRQLAELLGPEAVPKYAVAATKQLTLSADQGWHLLRDFQESISVTFPVTFEIDLPGNDDVDPALQTMREQLAHLRPPPRTAPAPSPAKAPQSARSRSPSPTGGRLQAVLSFFKKTSAVPETTATQPSGVAAPPTPVSRALFHAALRVRSQGSCAMLYLSCTACSPLRAFRPGDYHIAHDVCPLHRAALVRSPAFDSFPPSAKRALCWPVSRPLGDTYFEPGDGPLVPHNASLPLGLLEETLLFGNRCCVVAPPPVIYSWSEMDVNKLFLEESQTAGWIYGPGY
jgi:hypothetical protein